MQQEHGCRRQALRRIRFDGVVVDPHRLEAWQQAKEIPAPAVVALHYLFTRDVVTTARDALAHAFGVELDVLQAGKPHVYGEATACRTLEKLGHRLAAKGGLEGEIQMLFDRALEERSSLAPGGCVDLAHRRRGIQVCIGGNYPASGLVRVVEAHPGLEQRCTPDAALAGS